MLASRCTSEILRRFMNLMNRSPNHAEMMSERMSASSDLNEM
jgi:hypothetical protein